MTLRSIRCPLSGSKIKIQTYSVLVFFFLNLLNKLQCYNMCDYHASIIRYWRCFKKLLKSWSPDHYWGPKRSPKFNIEVHRNKSNVLKSSFQEIQCNNLWDYFHDPRIPRSCRFSIVQTVTPRYRYYVDPKRGSKFNNQIYRENVLKSLFSRTMLQFLNLLFKHSKMYPNYPNIKVTVTCYHYL